MRERRGGMWCVCVCVCVCVRGEEGCGPCARERRDVVCVCACVCVRLGLRCCESVRGEDEGCGVRVCAYVCVCACVEGCGVRVCRDRGVRVCRDRGVRVCRHVVCVCVGMWCACV